MLRFCNWMALVGTVASSGIGLSAAEMVRGKPDEVVARFHDGTTIRRVVLQDQIDIRTKYGKLAVPVGDIRRIEFGLRIPDETAKKIAAAIKELGGDDFRQREAAGKELVALGAAAYPALLAAAKSDDQEVARRAQTALDQIRKWVPEDRLRTRVDDVIHARDSVLTGRIETPVLRGKTAYFGEMQFKLADLRSIHSMAGSVEARVALDATKHAVHGQWLDTGIVVEADMGLVITAVGNIDLIAQNPGGLPSGPNGQPSAGQINGYFPGTLLGKIGEKGEVFVIGAHHEARSKREGKLYLHIVPVQAGAAGAASSGAYQVKVATGHDLTINETNTQGQPVGPSLPRYSPAGFAPPPAMAPPLPVAPAGP